MHKVVEMVTNDYWDFHGKMDQGNYETRERTLWKRFMLFWCIPVWLPVKTHTIMRSTDTVLDARVALGERVVYDNCFPDGLKDDDVTEKHRRDREHYYIQGKIGSYQQLTTGWQEIRIPPKDCSDYDG